LPYPVQETPANIRTNLIFLETKIIALLFAGWQLWSTFIQILFLVGTVKRFFPQECVSAVQGHPRSLILVPMESAHVASYLSVIVTVVLSCTVSEILQV